MATSENSAKSRLDEEALNNFRQYLRIPTVHPNINYDECVKFLENLAKSLDLPFKIYRVSPHKPIMVITWAGKEPDLSSIWLNSHMDVVAVYEDKWTYKPFEAHMDDEGNIYARGAQDMKSVGIQYLEAIKRLRKNGFTPKRTIHVGFVPEEEERGVMGMMDFTTTEDFRKLNVGFALDEGVPSPNEDFAAFYGERTNWKLRVHCPGQQGHGSLLLQHPPGNKIGVVIRKFNEFRNEQLKEFMKKPNWQNLGNVTTINITKLEGGVQANVIPPEFTATFDVRISPSLNVEKFENDINSWCKEAGEGVWVEYLAKEDKVSITKLDDSNLFWTAFKRASEELKMTIVTSIFAGASDARFIRKLDIPAIGFSPINNTQLKLHDNDEYLNKKVFLKGIEIYAKIILAISNA